MDDRTLLQTGIIGTPIAAVCCFAPVLVVLLGAVGLSAWLGWLDYVLLPALVLFLALTAYAIVQRWRKTLSRPPRRSHARNAGHRETETMPTDACQFFYDCNGCGAVLRPRSGDGYVFRSYGDVPCPPIQAAQQGGTGAAPGCCD
jgi:mercuric ion transport protein